MAVRPPCFYYIKEFLYRAQTPVLYYSQYWYMCEACQQEHGFLPIGEGGPARGPLIPADMPWPGVCLCTVCSIENNQMTLRMGIFCGGGLPAAREGPWVHPLGGSCLLSVLKMPGIWPRPGLVRPALWPFGARVVGMWDVGMLFCRAEQ